MIILIQCTDQKGLVAAIAGVLARLSINITGMREYVDVATNRFYVRIATQETTDTAKLQQMLEALLPEDASIVIDPAPEKKVIVLVTKEYHCLSDMLIRHHFKTLNATIQCVIGNHEVLKEICEKFKVPFYFIPHEDKTKASFEQEINTVIDQYESDYLVLAKFMRILSPGFNARHTGKIINIHHSFLPAFVGASPYKQAFERGVKVIGATAHFVTDELDEGPIIVQQTTTINHNFTVADMVKAGKEIETSVLAKALQLVFDSRVFVYRNKTIVFE